MDAHAAQRVAAALADRRDGARAHHEREQVRRRAHRDHHVPFTPGSVSPATAATSRCYKGGKTATLAPTRTGTCPPTTSACRRCSRRLPRLLHGARQRRVELQLHGRAALGADALRAEARQPEGILPPLHRCRAPSAHRYHAFRLTPTHPPPHTTHTHTHTHKTTTHTHTPHTTHTHTKQHTHTTPEAGSRLALWRKPKA